ncbi:hypothetical protein GGR53DRAFT_352113 [Hypoxylon sp. FL1150]|nr:hypothetical protein GGR53DRAFT_352113 [Hypoxylon sp. FL1150]
MTGTYLGIFLLLTQAFCGAGNAKRSTGVAGWAVRCYQIRGLQMRFCLCDLKPGSVCTTAVHVQVEVRQATLTHLCLDFCWCDVLYVPILVPRVLPVCTVLMYGDPTTPSGQGLTVGLNRRISLWE